MFIKFGGLSSKCISLILTGYNLINWSSNIHFRAIINGDSRGIRSIFLCMQLALRFYTLRDSFHKRTIMPKERKQMSKIVML